MGLAGFFFVFFFRAGAALRQREDSTQRAEALITLQHTNPFCLFACNSFTTDSFTVSAVAAVTQILVHFFFAAVSALPLLPRKPERRSAIARVCQYIIHRSRR